MEFSTIALTSSYSFLRSTLESISFTASAPIPTLNALGPYCSWKESTCASERTCLYCNSVSPGSSTMNEAKYTTCSSALGGISSSKPIRLGTPLKYQICVTGAASSTCPIRSLRTFALVTSTPHLSQITPLYLTLLYFPQ